MNKGPYIHYHETPAGKKLKSFCGKRGSGTYTQSPVHVTCDECLKIMKENGYQSSTISNSTEKTS